MHKFTAIIPFFNESPSILSTIRALLDVKYIDQVVCVDDGSTNNTFQLIKDNYSKTDLVKLDKNYGKSHAVFEGLKIAKNNNIILMDADLIGLKNTELSRAINKFEENNLDCLVLSTASTSEVRS